MKNTIQTGLRLPLQVHLDLKAKSEEMGISINQLILVLIYLGMKGLNEDITPPAGEV